MVTTEEKKKVKFRWLISSLIYILAPPILIFLIDTIYTHIEHRPLNNIECLASISISPLLFVFPILYFCAYKKPGTKLITLFLFNVPLYHYFKVTLDNGSNLLTTPLTIITFLSISLIQIYWLIQTYRLRSLNLRLKKQPPPPPTVENTQNIPQP